MVDKQDGFFRKFLEDAANINNSVTEELREIDIDALIPNPKNFYGIRDIDELTGMMVWTKDITPLTVKDMNNGKYMIVKGHRRWTAAKKAVVEGLMKKRTLPCKVRLYRNMSLSANGGNKVDLTAEDAELLELIFDNRGQRKTRTIAEQIAEIHALTPFARKMYAANKDSGEWSNFQNYFANEILGMAQTTLQRKQMLIKCMPEVIEAVDNNLLSETYAVELSFRRRNNGNDLRQS